MKRIIYSIYIDIPQDELDYQPPYHGETESKNDKSKREFAKHYEWLVNRQKEYAQSIGVEYKIFLNDDQWKDFKSDYQKRYPFLTTYNIVNFYKIHLMYLMGKQYDEILYIDLDVVPFTERSFFDIWNLQTGVAIKRNAHGAETRRDQMTLRQGWYEKFGKTHSIRSPAAKFWNSKAMLMEYDYFIDEPSVFNTGIVGISKKHLDQMDYFSEFDESLELMSELRDDPDSLWPSYIHDSFGWDNETLWGVKAYMNEVPIHWLCGRWHYFMDKMNVIPDAAEFVHVINKEFEFTRKRYEHLKNSL